MDKPGAKRPVNVTEASRLLGISPELVRKWYQRKKLEGYKDESGRLFVYVEDNVTDKSRTKTAGELYEQTLTIMQNYIDTIEGQLKEKDGQIQNLSLELRRKDILYMQHLNEKNEVIRYLSEPKKSFVRRLLSGRTDE